MLYTLVYESTELHVCYVATDHCRGFFFTLLRSPFDKGVEWIWLNVHTSYLESLVCITAL